VSDRTWGLLEWLRGASVGALLTLRARTTPSPQHRPRVTQRGITYYPKAYQTYHADCMKQFAQQKPDEPLQGDVGVVVETVCARPKKTKLSAPKGDSDNYAKAPLDAATKARVWGDDAQAVPLASTRRWTEPGEEPGVYLHIGALPNGTSDQPRT
jgi:Holliday junction resolvase RusA-like endonuclease